MTIRIRFLILTIALLCLLPLSSRAEKPPEAAPAPAVSTTETAPKTGTGDDNGVFKKIKEGFSLHRENYFVFTWSNVAETIDDSELKFQLSLRQRLLYSLYFAYTQRSFWRIFDQEDSRPFRETTYNPELFYRFQREDSEKERKWGADLGIEHESNGGREPNSRSWNRLYIAPFYETDHLLFKGDRLRTDLKLWHRLSENAKETPDDTIGDENPDIEDFYGYGELRLAYTHPSRHRAALMTRWNFATDKGALQFDYYWPTGTENLFVYGQVWTGYGESIIDYNRSVTRYGIGLAIRQ